MKKIIFLIILFITSSLFSLPLHKIKLLRGFKISLYAYPVPNARAMVFSPKGILYVGSRKRGVVYAIQDKNNDKKADRIKIIARKLDQPVGVDYYQGDLYFSSIHKIYKIKKIDKVWMKNPRKKLITKRFPKDRWHGWKFMRFGPDGWLYIPVGAPCNICYRRDKRYSSIMRMKKDGSKIEIYAHGIRNSVGFDWHPVTKQLWFTENGGDYMGDNIPPDELNLAYKKGLHFGFPFIHGSSIRDRKYGYYRKWKKIRFIKPKYNFIAHSAVLGMRFYTGKMFPKKYKHQIFVAEHGSWNRSKKSGYRISVLFLKGNKVIKYKVFAYGFMKNEVDWGRPADVVVGRDGALYVSDDKAGAIYRNS